MKKGYYKCECGKEFDNPQKFNSHKSHCENHLKITGRYEYVSEKRKQGHKKGIQTRKHKEERKKEFELNNWISEKHTCEHCGKVITDKFGSGRFCSRSCANSRFQTDIIKSKKRLSNRKAAIKNRLEHPEYWIKGKKRGRKITIDKPKLYCKMCGKELSYKSKTGICGKCLTTTEEGLKIFKSYATACGRSKHGYYKNYRCDSTYELIWTIYCLDHNISFKRCDKRFIYYYKGKKHTYNPDFELSDGTLIELKGYYSELVDIKAKSVTTEKLKVFYKKDIQYMFDYVKENYQYKKLEDLYDK